MQTQKYTFLPIYANKKEENLDFRDFFVTFAAMRPERDVKR